MTTELRWCPVGSWRSHFLSRRWSAKMAANHTLAIPYITIPYYTIPWHTTPLQHHLRHHTIDILCDKVPCLQFTYLFVPFEISLFGNAWRYFYEHCNIIQFAKRVISHRFQISSEIASCRVTNCHPVAKKAGSNIFQKKFINILFRNKLIFSVCW